MVEEKKRIINAKECEVSLTGFPIKVVAKKTGLSQHVIRVWEKRYDAIVPERTATNRRVYSEKDVQKLLLLRKATLAGYNIGTVAPLSTQELLDLLAPEEQTVSARDFVGDSEEGGIKGFLSDCIELVIRLDPGAFERRLNQALVNYGKDVVLSELISPLMHQIGTKWRDGEIRILHEHMATEVIRHFLYRNTAKPAHNGSAPRMVVTTPVGQLHEFGALIVAEASASDGWKVQYLGPNLPAEEIAAAVKSFKASVVCLSIVYPGDDQNVAAEIIRLGQMLPTEVSVIAGGLLSVAYSQSLNAIGAFTTNDIEEMRLKLRSIRAGTVS